MTIDILCRVRYPQLYARMCKSARATTSGGLGFIFEDDDGSPKLAESYNRMGARSKADILLFVHDDVIFIDQDWDKKLVEGFDLGFDVLGVSGSKNYEGGTVFQSGREHAAGKYSAIVDGKRVVRLMFNDDSIEPVKVLDGMFLATTREHFRDNRFDEKLGGLFFYDLDYCLRSRRATVDILVSHEKPNDLRGKYPDDMKPQEFYEPYFLEKHSLFANYPTGDQRVDTVLLTDYVGRVNA